ncbi:3-hydroxyacyl-CoA dehydrogenase NAD-binding domain-containing protein, partial [Clostridiisalibacter paucivorans]|uniref:3-hydroxyacyl-CoA dehydrogenase NAD-binding domain-containing protein n=1 Tax=Clostridiisalibacter paucivorans TaxID=408753 RepID=UPI00047880BD
MKVCVLGAGTMGSGIAQTFAQSGHEVVIRDLKQEFLDKGVATITKNLDRAVSKGKLTEEARNDIRARITITTELKDIKDVDLVVEAAVENMDIKKKIFAELDEVCKAETILASNTSSLSITEIGSATKRPDKVIGMHFFNPVPVMKLVEVIKGIATSDETKNTIVELSKDLGKSPVEVEEAPGFVVNRILIPMINEAVGILADGVATAEDI